ncbi:outer membrane beta-barrel protein, partial [Brucella abortus]|nr:outer membrane beta-barrel protein [Brucella abortus]
MQADSDDPRLANISGPSINAMVNWSPLRGMDMRFLRGPWWTHPQRRALPVRLQHFASLDVTRRVRANLSFNGKLDANIRQNKDAAPAPITRWAQR